MKIRAKHVVVIGGGSGIGLATARRMLELGVETVVLAGRSPERLKNAKAQLEESMSAHVSLDMTAGQDGMTSVLDGTNLKTPADMKSASGLECAAGRDGATIKDTATSKNNTKGEDDTAGNAYATDGNVDSCGKREKVSPSGARDGSWANRNAAILTETFDITDTTEHRKWLDALQERIGATVDGLVISSGVNFAGSNWRGFNISESDYDRVMNTNLKGPFFLIRNYSDYIYRQRARANICVVSSISAHRDMLSVYQISKHSLSGTVRAYGKYLAQRGIILNCVEPGSTDTGMMPHLKRYTDGIRQGAPWKDNALGRVLRAEEIADCVCYLMSENSEALSGTCLLAGGGCRSI